MSDNLRLFVYRQVVILVALLAVAGCVCSAFHLSFFFLAISALAGIFLGALARSFKLMLILGLLPVMFALYVDFRQDKPAQDDLSNWNDGRLVVLKAVVDEMPRLDARGHSQLVVRVEEVISPRRQRVSGKCLIRMNGAVKLAVNDSIEVKILLDKPQANVHAWDFDNAEYLHKRGVSQGAWLSKPDDIRVIKSGEHDWLYEWQQVIVASRKHLVDTHCRYLGDTEGALLTSMVIGDRAVNLPDVLVKQFRDVGLSHVLAASGFNLTIVCGCALFLVRLLFKSIWIGNIACLVSMLSFVVIAGPSPSVLRSAFMLCFLLVYRTISRKAPISMALAGAIICAIILDPFCITDIGFQLSYVATAAIVIGVEPFKKIFSRFDNRWGIGETVSVIVIAQMGVLPIQLYYFWCLGLFFLPANLLVAPFVHLVTLAGFASSWLVLVDQYLGWLEHFIWLIDKITWLPLSAILICVKYMASFEQAKLVLGAPHIVSLVVYYLAFAIFLISLKRDRWRLLASCLLVVAICLLTWRPVPTSQVIAFFKNSIVVLRLDRKAVVLGQADAPAVKKFLLYHGALICSAENSLLKVEQSFKSEQVFIPEIKTLLVEVQDQVIGDGPFCRVESKFETLVFSVRGKMSPSRVVDRLLCNEQFGGFIQEGKTIWLVFDKGLSKVGRASIVSRLPSCVKIATRIGNESLVFEACNESIKIRD